MAATGFASLVQREYPGSMTTARQPLADGFAQVDREYWHELVAKALIRSHRAPGPEEVEGLLGTRADDGFMLKPIYTREDLAELPLLAGSTSGEPGGIIRDSGQRGGWSVRQRYWGTASQIRTAMAIGVENGVDSAWVTLLPDRISSDEVPGLLRDIDFARTSVTLEAFEHPLVAAAMLLDASNDEDIAIGTCLGLDPLGGLAATGVLGDVDASVEMGRRALERGLRAFSIDATIYHDAGASSGEELGAATAAGLSTLRWLTSAGLTVDQAASLLEFRFAVTDDQFASIAKLRAARLLWKRVLEVAGADPGHTQQQHAVTAWSMLTRRDPWVNLIRNTVAAFAAGTGGAQAVTVLPHNMADEFPDEFAKRMARNTQHLLLAESHVGVVSDPLGGSWYGETRTRQVADAAWEWVQEIEGSGGLRSALESGLVADRIDRSWERQAENVARRIEPITGVSEFPDAKRSTAIPTGAFRRPEGGLPQRRPSEQFENLRDRSDRAVAGGKQVRVWTVTVGTLAKHSARLGFATNLFAVGGIETTEVPFVEGNPIEIPEAGSSPPVVCICGADSDYEALIGELGRALPESQAVWLAGKPRDLAEEYASAGITGYLYAGCNVVDVLETTLADLEVSQ